MPFLSSFVKATVTALLARQAFAVPLKVDPIPGDYVVTVNNTINATAIHNPVSPVAKDSPPSALPLSFVNNIGGTMNAYLAGTDGDGAAFFLQADGTPYYPPNPAAGIPPTTIDANIAIPLDPSKYGSVTVKLPNYLSSGRIYFAMGTMSFAVNNGPTGPVIVAPSFTNPSDPNADVQYGFVEFTWSEEQGIFSNLSYVDFVGLVISQVVQTYDASTSTTNTCTVEGLPYGAVDTICNALAAQGQTDGQAWAQSCQTDSSGTNLRVLAPLHLVEVDQSALSGYYDSYIDQVWEKYTSEQLVITAGDRGNFTGQVDSSSGLMVFDQGGSYQKPVLGDILGCNSGPFSNPTGDDAEAEAAKAIVARFCAAFDRSTLLLDGGNYNPDGVPVSEYYPTDGTPTNHYARIVHATETDGKGYAFSYDDVAPGGVDAVSGQCSGPDPQALTFTVGGAS